jgi:hypothetical protein
MCQVRGFLSNLMTPSDFTTAMCVNAKDRAKMLKTEIRGLISEKLGTHLIPSFEV